MRSLCYVFIFVVINHISKHFEVEYLMDVGWIFYNIIIAQTATL